MKKLYIMCLLLLGCAEEIANTRSTMVADNRVPRYCFVRGSREMKCFGTAELCSEGEFEDRHIGHQHIHRSCRMLRVERNLLPYWDQYHRYLNDAGI